MLQFYSIGAFYSSCWECSIVVGKHFFFFGNLSLGHFQMVVFMCSTPYKLNVSSTHLQSMVLSETHHTMLKNSFWLNGGVKRLVFSHLFLPLLTVHSLFPLVPLCQCVQDKERGRAERGTGRRNGARAARAGGKRHR